jgi:hypothetical protein
MLAYDATFNGQAAVDPIDIAPFEGQAFAYSQTKTTADQRYRLERIREMPNELAELLDRQTAGLFLAFTGTLDCYQFDGVALCGDRPVPHCEVP